MGLREKTDFNLQLISLGCVLAVVLVLVAARRYTSDWRERREFRRLLASTQRRLAQTTRRRSAGDIHTVHRTAGGRRATITAASTSNSTPDTRQRRRWKRFVAAVPLMPLATAYVAVRVGWDVVEVLVFCAIDVIRNSAGRAAAAARAAAMTAYSGMWAIWQRVELQRRAADVVVVVVEATVGWAFNTGAPAIARAVNAIGHWIHMGAGWWVERGGPMLRDAIEVTVLEYVVPATAASWHAAVATFERTFWLTAQMWEALAILAADLLSDLRAVWSGIAVAWAWMTDHQRWWFDPRLAHILQRQLVGLRQIRDQLANQALPWCATAIETFVVWMYIGVLCPAFSSLALAGDWLLQHTAGLGVHLCQAMLVTGTALVRLWSGMARASVYIFAWLRPAVRTVAVHTRRVVVWVGPIAVSTADVCNDIYVRIQDAVVVPLMRAIAAGATGTWHRLQALEPWIQHAWQWTQCYAALVFCYALTAIQTVGQRVHPLLIQLLHTLRTQHERWWHIVRSYGWDTCMEMLTGGSAVGARVQLVMQQMQLIVQWMQQQLALLWPGLQRASRDGGRAMADVYVQLVALVDAVVALVGDLVVEYARRNAVHGSHSQTESKSAKKNE
ncbi:hypothetical protein H4S00_000348 [Coemansia sp. D1744]|nr:hypothetical protein IWW35_000448 [Coemansia sp. RSA 1878]KAJ2729725.1 hypothetical protein H4S00_000348 [Coemansia sp. D1744]